MTTTPGVRVEVPSGPATQPSGVQGFAFTVRRTDFSTRAVGVSVDYGAFRYAYGGDWASRLRLVELPSGRPVPSRNDPVHHTVTADVAVGTQAQFALTAAASGSAGDYKATALSSARPGRVRTANGARFTGWVGRPSKLMFFMV